MRILVVCIFIFTACTSLNSREFETRITESMSGELSAPGDIDPAGENQFHFAVFGDIHIGTPFGEIIDRAATTAIADGDAFVLAVGDIADTGKTEQFQRFKEVMGDMPYRVALGNHDTYFGGWENFKAEFGSSIYSFNADNVHITVLDSANGILGKRQLEWLENDLKNSDKPIKIILTHEPPYAGRVTAIWRMSSDEEIAILKDICHRYAVKYFLAGHYHGYYDVTYGNTTYITTGGVNPLTEIGFSPHFIRVTVQGEQVSFEKIAL